MKQLEAEFLATLSAQPDADASQGTLTLTTSWGTTVQPPPGSSENFVMDVMGRKVRMLNYDYKQVE